MRKTIVLPALLFAIAGIGCNPTDAEAPTINSLNLSLNEAYVGETVTVDYDIEDNVTSKENLDVSLTLYYADKEVELKSNTFTINEAVDHSVALIVKDEAGNESSKTVSVEVSNQYSWSAEQNEDIMSTLGLESNPFPLLKEFGDVTLEPTTNVFETVNYFTITVEDVDDPIERLGGLLEIAGFKYAEDLSGDTGMEWTDDGTPVVDTVYTLENQFDNEKKVVEAIMEYCESSKTFIYILKNYVYPTTTESTTWDEDALNVALAPYTVDQIIVEFTLENPSSDVNFVFIDMHEEFLAPFLSILVYNPSETDVTNFVNNMFTSLPDYNDGLSTVDEIVKLIMEDEDGYIFMAYIFDDSGSMLVPMIQVYFAATGVLEMDIVCMTL